MPRPAVFDRYNRALNFVHHKIGNETFEHILNFLQEQSIILWGSIQPVDFLEQNLVLTLYKDLNGIGYQKTLSEVGSKRNILKHISFMHNSKII